MTNLNTTNAIGYRFQLFGVAQGSRTKLDAKTIGFPATPSHNRQETVLSPAGVSNIPPATVMTLTVKSVVFIRVSGKVKIKVTRADTTFYEQLVDSVFSMSPADPVTVSIETAELFNVNCLAVWS